MVGKLARRRKHLERLKRTKGGPGLWKSRCRRHDFRAEELRAIWLASLTATEIYIDQMDAIVVDHGEQSCGWNRANAGKSSVGA